MRKKLALAVLLIMGLTLSMANVTALAGNYPNRPIELIVPWAPGGGSDTLMRLVTKHIRQYLGVPMQVINIPGVSGTIGLQQFSHKRPDGYSLAMIHDGLLTSHYTGVTPLNWDSFVPITQLTASPQFLAVNSKSPWKTLDDFLSYAKDHPGEVTFGVTMLGSAHVMGKELEEAAGVKFRYVGYEGTGQRVQALMGGHIDAIVVDKASSEQYVKAGYFRLLALGHDERLPQFPDVPTFAELGYPDLVWSVPRGIVAPKGTPESVLKVLDDAFAKLAKDPKFREEVENLGSLVVYRDRQTYTEYLKKRDEVIKAIAPKLQQ
ncbi:MAG: tripartite tricarboxylate transporter substrate binding protein [Firmicutes bacterium]|nr:tripartite tricarboxylate transporter substrate binding protein [Bacillota bacterium]